MTEPCVEIEGVTKRFGEDLVLKEVNLVMESGKVYGIVGNNGSGKTVLMKCICGFVKPTSGEIQVDGQVIGKDIDFIPNAGIIIETPGFIPNYSGYKNLQLLASIQNRIDKTRIREVMQMVGLDPDMKRSVKKYSLGMRQRLGLAQAIMEDPSVLVLDEPFNGLDKEGVVEMRQYLLQLKDAGKAIMVCSHSSEDIAVLCDRVYEMEHGKLTPK